MGFYERLVDLFDPTYIPTVKRILQKLSPDLIYHRHRNRCTFLVELNTQNNGTISTRVCAGKNGIIELKSHLSFSECYNHAALIQTANYLSAQYYYLNFFAEDGTLCACYVFNLFGTRKTAGLLVTTAVKTYVEILEDCIQKMQEPVKTTEAHSRAKYTTIRTNLFSSDE